MRATGAGEKPYTTHAVTSIGGPAGGRAGGPRARQGGAGGVERSGRAPGKPSLGQTCRPVASDAERRPTLP